MMETQGQGQLPGRPMHEAILDLPAQSSFQMTVAPSCYVTANYLRDSKQELPS